MSCTVIVGDPAFFFFVFCLFASSCRSDVWVCVCEDPFFGRLAAASVDAWEDSMGVKGQAHVLGIGGREAKGTRVSCVPVFMGHGSGLHLGRRFGQGRTACSRRRLRCP
ncbi:hypothetical protein V8C26DRAFT_276857 [Trichoderma gracile]